MKTIRITVFAVICLASGMSASAQQMPPTIVVVEDAGMKMLAPTIDVPGTVVSRNDSRLASELSAKLKWIADVGTVVKEGDTVARLDDITFRLLEMEAQSRVDREQARITFLRAERERLERLRHENLSAKSQLDQTTSNLAVAESDKAIAEAQLGQAKVAMYVTEIRAPFDGIVTEKLRNIGERLNVADEVIHLVNPDSVEVVARAPLNTVNFIKDGDILEVHNDYRKGNGVVRTTVPFGDPQSHMFEVRLNIDPSLWTVGESVRLSMPTAHAREVMTVPRDALVLRREGIFVFRIREDMTAEQVNVITGLGAGSLIEIIGDVQPSDRVVIRGAERLTTGMVVQIRADEGSNGAGNSSASQ